MEIQGAYFLRRHDSRGNYGEGRDSQPQQPDRGVLKLYFELIKQDGTVCQSGTKAIMMKRTAQKEG